MSFNFMRTNSRTCGASTVQGRFQTAAISFAHREAKNEARSPARRGRLTHYASTQRHASVRSFEKPYSSRGSDNGYEGTSIVNTIDELARSSKRTSDQAWADILETYLPKRLRSDVQVRSETRSEDVSVQQVYTLPLLLAKARGVGKLDLLSHMGLHQGRWEAVKWLVEALLENYAAHSEMSRRQSLPPHVPWETTGNLDDLTQNPIAVDFPQPSKISMDILTALDSHSISARGYWRRRLGQVWQSLAGMVVHAEDRSVEHPKSDSIIPHVLQILARLHRNNVLPPSIYNYDPPNDPFALKRPPTLYLLSARIMTALSDVAWNNHWKDEMEKAETFGYELHPARVQPQLHHVGAEVWLELILWACVEGGYVEEGAQILARLEKRKSSKDMKWSVISWEEVQMKAPKLKWTALLKIQLNRSRLNQATGIPIANSGVGQVNMGNRTISEEVVRALLDGIVNMASANAEDGGIAAAEVQELVTICKRLLEKNRPMMEADTMSAIILRLVESVVLGSDGSPGVLKRLLDLRSTKIEKHTTSDQSRLAQSAVSAATGEMDLSASILGLLHRNLHDFAQVGNFQGTFMTLRHIQEVIDQNRNFYIAEFAAELKERLRSRDQDLQNNRDSPVKASPLLHPQIPVAALIALFGLINNGKEVALGKWLLYNDDIDGGILEPSIYSDPNLQPSLLRFATVSADDQLLTRILERLEPPLSESILHEILCCQAFLSKWDAVHGVLKYFQQTRGTAWRARDAMAIAASLSNLGNGATDGKSKSISQGGNILRDLLQGRYDSPQNPSQVPIRERKKLAYNLRQILSSTPGISHLISPSEDNISPRLQSGVVPSAAFNVLLEATVENHGSFAAKDLWQKWCMFPGDIGAYDRGATVTFTSSQQSLVKPTLYMLRTITRPVVQRVKRQRADASKVNTVQADQKVLHNTNQERQKPPVHRNMREELTDQDRSILEWGHSMLQRFRLPQKEINAEIPHSLWKPRLVTSS